MKSSWKTGLRLKKRWWRCSRFYRGIHTIWRKAAYWASQKVPKCWFYLIQPRDSSSSQVPENRLPSLTPRESNLPPFIIGAAKIHRHHWYPLNVSSPLFFATSHNGYADDELGYEWPNRVAEPSMLEEVRNDFLLLDGRKGHLTGNALDLVTNHGGARTRDHSPVDTTSAYRQAGSTPFNPTVIEFCVNCNHSQEHQNSLVCDIIHRTWKVQLN